MSRIILTIDFKIHTSIHLDE